VKRSVTRDRAKVFRDFWRCKLIPRAAALLSPASPTFRHGSSAAWSCSRD